MDTIHQQKIGARQRAANRSHAHHAVAKRDKYGRWITFRALISLGGLDEARGGGGGGGGGWAGNEFRSSTSATPISEIVNSGTGRQPDWGCPAVQGWTIEATQWRYTGVSVTTYLHGTSAAVVYSEEKEKGVYLRLEGQFSLGILATQLPPRATWRFTAPEKCQADS